MTFLLTQDGRQIEYEVEADKNNQPLKLIHIVDEKKSFREQRLDAQALKAFAEKCGIEFESELSKLMWLG